VPDLQPGVQGTDRRPELDLRTIAAAAIALVGGIGIALMDSSRGFDDTGITAVGLLLVAALAAALDGRRPLLWAVLVGAWIPLLEIPAARSSAPLAALVFAGIGAVAGHLAARGLSSPRSP
jgi:hypothetical protein